MKSYTVVYRTGGPDRCEWKASLPVDGYDTAKDVAADLELAGYKSMIYKTRDLDVIGLPEGWDYSAAGDDIKAWLERA